MGEIVYPILLDAAYLSIAINLHDLLDDCQKHCHWDARSSVSEKLSCSSYMIRRIPPNRQLALLDLQLAPPLARLVMPGQLKLALPHLLLPASVCRPGLLMVH